MNDDFNEPPFDGLAYDFGLAYEGFMQWRANGYERMPSPDDVMRIDPAWRRDLSWCRAVYEARLKKRKGK